MNRGFKMKDYKRLLAFLATTILLLAIVPPINADLGDLPRPFVTTDGKFNAYIVVGEDAEVSDVIGAIEVAAAFAQKAVTPVAGATAGGATIDVKTFKGTGDAEVAIYSSADPSSTLTAGYGAPTDDAKAILPNYTYVLNNVNYTAVEQAKITNITVDEYLGITIPAGAVVHTCWLRNDTSDVTDIVGKTIRVAGTNYYVVNFTQNGNITLGEATNYTGVSIPWTTTMAGKTITIHAVSSDGKYANVTVGSTNKIINITGGQSNTIEDVTLIITNVVSWGTYSTADVNIIASTERWEHNKEWSHDTRFKVDLSQNGKVILKNINDITLSDLGNFTGPANSWTFYYKEKEQKPANSETWSIKEADQTSVTLKLYPGNPEGTFNATGVLPGFTVDRCTTDTCTYRTSVSQPIDVSVGDGTPAFYVRVKDPGGSYLLFALDNDSIYESPSVYGVYYEDAGNASNYGNLTVGTPVTFSTGMWVNRTDQNTVVIKISGPELYLGSTRYYISFGVSGIYSSAGSQVTGPQTYGEKVSWDGSKFTLTEPDGSSWYVTFSKNATDGSVYVSSYNLPTNNTNTSYGTYVVFNNVSDTYDWNTNGFVNFTVYRKDAVSAIGQWIFTPLSLGIGEEQAVGNTTIRLTNVTGVGGVNVNLVETGFAKLDSELASPTDKPLIVIGGPAINKFAAEALGLPYPTYGAASGIPEGHYVIKYIENSTIGQPVLLIAGYDAEQTRCACQHVASYILYGQPALEEIWSCSEYRAST